MPSLRLIVKSLDTAVPPLSLTTVLITVSVPSCSTFVIVHTISVSAAGMGTGGRLVHHPPEFVAQERRYRDYERAREWQEERIGDLLRSARTGKPMKVRSKGFVQRLLFPC